MDPAVAQSSNWSVDLAGMTSPSTSGVSVTAITDEASSVTVATIVGVTMVVLVAIAAVFVLGILIDCRHQRLLEQKMGQVKRLKTLRQSNKSRTENANIAEQMEDTGMSEPPAASIKDIP